MKRHIRLLTSVAVAGAMILSVSTSALAANAPQQPNTRPGVTTPVAPTAPAPNRPVTPPSTQPMPAPNRPATPPSTQPAPAPNVRPHAPNAPQHNQQNQHNQHGTCGRLGNSTLSNLVEYYENLVKHGVISQETASKIIDYMLNRYTGVSSSIGQIGVENKSSAIKFEQRADGGAMFFEQKPDGKIIFFEQTPGKGAVYHEHNPFGNVNALNSAIVHSQMVNEGVITQSEAQAISQFESRANKNEDEDK